MHDHKHHTTRAAILLITVLTLLVGLQPIPAQALTYPQVILLSQPERYARLDETSGTIITDLAYGINGSYSSVTLNQSGAIYDGNPGILTGSGSVTYPSIGLVGHSYACEAWFKVASTPANNAVRSICNLSVSGGESWYVNLGYNTAQGYKLTFGHLTTLQLATAVTPDAWHHMVCQFNYTTNYVEIYLDTTLIANFADSSFTTANARLTAGNSATTMTFYLDEIAYYHHTLTVGEINNHYAAAAAAFVTATPTITETPTITPTSTNTPTPTPPAEFPITVGSYQGFVSLSVSAGEAASVIVSTMLLVGVLFAIGLYLIRWRRR
ncbi:MAG: hypothetical protein KF716_14880 [Anaerolineae bacterium]|nr:hypothetical protein [Anaerolineae bacterium]